jgi:hypothetical protein
MCGEKVWLKQRSPVKRIVNTCSWRINYNVWKVFVIFTIPDKEALGRKDLMPFFVE